MLVSISKVKGMWVFLKNRIKYPFVKNKLGELNPNVFFGYTDHPLDINATPITTAFSFLKKAFETKKSNCILQIELKEQSGNSFIFSAKGYNIFRVIDQNITYAHTYVVNEKTKYNEMCLNLDFLKEDAYRIRLAPGHSVPENNTPMLAKDIRDANLKVLLSENNEKYSLTTSKLKLDIYKKDFRIEIFDKDGKLITESGSKTKNEFPNAMDAFPLGFVWDKKNKRWYGVESFVLYPGEAIYGLGEQFGPINKVGQTIGFWHIEGYGNTSGRVYKHIPFFMSTRGYGVFVNESRPITFWVGSRELCKNQIAIEGESIDYYFFYGPSFTNILDNYTDLTGKGTVPPKWSFGTWISRISYFSQKQVMQVAQRLRDMKFPSDVIHIDTGWFEKDWLCDWEFDKKRFPDPEKMFKDAKDMGFRISLWQCPYVMKKTKIYKDAKKKKAVAKNNGPFAFFFVFEAAPIDLSNPHGVTWYKEKLQKLLKMGASAIKADFGEGIEPPMKFKEHDGRSMHNLYPLLYNKAVYEITKDTLGENNAVIWARSAYSGSQRYPMHWSGDNSANHENMLCSLRGGLSFGLSGFTFWSQDTGGFIGAPSDEAYIRWTQLTAFQSHMRFHGNPPRCREPWNFEPDTQIIVRDYLNLRYQLIPYLYTESQFAVAKGLPVLRHLVIDFQDDPTVYNIEDQFLSGRNLLIAPILTKNNSRDIYLPEGIWYDFWTGERFNGKQWIKREADMNTIPVYVRGGAILPLAKTVQCTDDLRYDGMTLKIYPDADNKAFYEILDKNVDIKINAYLENKMLKIKISPEIADIKVELPQGISASIIIE
jgi:alpha-D-xyloside xylohydrolase